jgi:hypothetical protein
MMGKLLVFAWLDVARLVGTVRARGLNTHLPTKEDFDRLPTDLKPGQIAEHELDVPIRFWNDRHSFLAPLSILSRVGYEFLSEESFADIIEEGLTEASTVEERLYHAFREEYWLWD